MTVPKGPLPLSIHTLLAFALVLIIPAPLDAQQTNSDTTSVDSVEPPNPVISEKRYRVEVIVFNYLGPISSNGEIWHRVSPFEFSPESYRPEPMVEEEDSNELINEPSSPIEFTELEALLPYLSKLHADSRYEVVTYMAWTQPLYEKKESIPVQLTSSTGVEPINEITPFTKSALTGSAQLFENRLLFVDIDIKNDFDSGLVDFSDPTSAIESPAGTHRIQEKRRVKLNEIHYFDHPFFGALFRVSREEP